MLWLEPKSRTLTEKNGWNYLVLLLVLEHCWETKNHSLGRVSTLHLHPPSTWGVVLIFWRPSKGFKGLFGLNRDSKWGWRLSGLDGGRLLRSKLEQHGSDWGHRRSMVHCAQRSLCLSLAQRLMSVVPTLGSWGRKSTLNSRTSLAIVWVVDQPGLQNKNLFQETNSLRRNQLLLWKIPVCIDMVILFNVCKCELSRIKKKYQKLNKHWKKIKEGFILGSHAFLFSSRPLNYRLRPRERSQLH